MAKQGGAFSKIIGAGIVLVSILSSVLLFDRLRVYDFVIHRRRPDDGLIQPHPILILEGIHIFARPEVRDLCDLRVYTELIPMSASCGGSSGIWRSVAGIWTASPFSISAR
mgnify:CR=1 FL=1